MGQLEAQISGLAIFFFFPYIFLQVSGSHRSFAASRGVETTVFWVIHTEPRRATWVEGRAGGSSAVHRDVIIKADAGVTAVWTGMSNNAACHSVRDWVWDASKDSLVTPVAPLTGSMDALEKK